MKVINGVTYNSIIEAAEKLGVSRTTIYDYAKNRGLELTQIGGRKFVSDEAISGLVKPVDNKVSE